MYLKNFKAENFLIFIDKLSKIYQLQLFMSYYYDKILNSKT